MKSLVFVLGVILILGITASTKAQSTEAPQTFWQKPTFTFEPIEKFKYENDYEYNTPVVVDARNSGKNKKFLKLLVNFINALTI